MSGSMECRVNGMYAVTIALSTVPALRREMNLEPEVQSLEHSMDIL